MVTRDINLTTKTYVVQKFSQLLTNHPENPLNQGVNTDTQTKTPRSKRKEHLSKESQLETLNPSLAGYLGLSKY